MSSQKDVASSIVERLAETDEFQRTLSAIKNRGSVVWSGCVGSSYVLLSGALSNITRRPMLVIVPKVGQVERVARELKLFAKAPIFPYPTLQDYLLDDPSEKVFVTDNSDLVARLKALKALCGESYNDETVKQGLAQNHDESAYAPIIVSSLPALLQPTPAHDQIFQSSIELAVEKEFRRETLIQWLQDGGFVPTAAVELRGEYSVRGSIVDIFSFEGDLPIRVEFFGDEIIEIREFNVSDQRTVRPLSSVVISYCHVKGAAQSRFDDYLTDDVLVVIRDVTATTQEARRISSEVNNKGCLTVDEAMNSLYRRSTIHAVDVATGLEYAQHTVEGNFRSVERLQGSMDHVDGALNGLEADEKVYVVCPLKGNVQRIQDTIQAVHPEILGQLYFTVGELSEGFEWRPGRVCFISDQQLFSRSSLLSSGKASSKSGVGGEQRRIIDSFLELNEGDYVVHVERGVARYMGIQRLTNANQEEDNLILQFADVRVYLPVSQIRKIQRYFGTTGTKGAQLSRYSNNKSWNKKKEEVRKSVWEYAVKMLQLQAARRMQKGISFDPDHEWQAEFENDFPFEETPDQVEAINIIKKDMESDRPMDRLLCGDVGFGKTEVAIRAAFKAVMSGYQVAILAPTTVLVEQHFRTLQERMVKFGVTVASLSRYSSKQEQAKTVEALHSGRIDVVVGTHRLLSKDVGFKKLGLVIIDEEQKFGVEHKEGLKRICNLVDVLTITATPIPRTLHLSLLGVRDVSNLVTPPANRLPIETKVLRYNESVIRRAVIRELNRGGQVYYVHNRVNDIDEAAERLRNLVPEASVDVGHAQMSTIQQENVMKRFIAHQFDILVSTTIIESGVDIPNANTMIIEGANQFFGLAQLHQLRGRVGRSTKQAYCYLTIPPDVSMSAQSTKRMLALSEYDKLGSGVQIAMKDLEIRGAGDILGTQQSGHLNTVGYEMYCDFLDAAIHDLKNEPRKVRIDVEVDLPCSAVFELENMDQSVKIDFYRRIDRASTFDEVYDIKDEMIDRFGGLPKDAKRFFKLAIIRVAAFQYGVKRLEKEDVSGTITHGKMLKVTFRSSQPMIDFQQRMSVRHIDVRILEDHLVAFLDFPRDLFTENGEPKEDRILEYVGQLFNAPFNDEDFEPKRKTLRKEKLQDAKKIRTDDEFSGEKRRKINEQKKRERQETKSQTTSRTSVKREEKESADVDSGPEDGSNSPLGARLKRAQQKKMNPK